MGAIKKISQEADLVSKMFNVTGEESAKRSDALTAWKIKNRKKLNRKGPSVVKVARGLLPIITDVPRFVDAVERGKDVDEYSAVTLPSDQELNFKLLIFTLACKLYELSYKFGHYKKNTGIDTIVSDKTGNYVGVINVTTTEIAREMFGVETPTNSQKKMVIELVFFLKKTYYEKKRPDGSIEIGQVIVPTLIVDPKTKQTSFQIAFCEEYTKNIQNQFGLFPRNVLKRLREIVPRLTLTHIDLLLKFGAMKVGEYTWGIDAIMEGLSIKEAYKKNPSRTEKQLLSYMNDLRKLGMFSKVRPIEGPKKHGRIPIKQINFAQDPEFTRTNELPEANESTFEDQEEQEW